MQTNRRKQSSTPTDQQTSGTKIARTDRDRAVEAAGGDQFIAAAAVLEGFPRAVFPHSRATTQINREVRAAEAAALRAFAINAGLLLDGERFERVWREQGEMGGSENDIHYEESTGRVWKRNRIDVMLVSWVQFFDRMLLHNVYFPEAPLRLEGFVDSERGFCPVFTQPDVHAVCGAPRVEVEPLMETRGYSRKSCDDYSNALLKVEDLHDGNVLVDEAGELQVIDPVLSPRDRF